MRRKIEQLLNGIFEYETPEMILSEEMIYLTLQKGTVYRGSFILENSAQKKMKGLIYSSNARIAYEPIDFSGIDAKIIYEVNTKGLEEGDVLEGAFSICSSIGEYRLPYHIEIQRSMVKTPQGEALNLEELVNLAYQDYQKAYLCFLADGFDRMITESAPEFSALYEGIRREPSSYRSLEEFLTGAGKKEPVRIKMSQNRRFFEKVNQTIKESIVLTKSTWGFLRLDVSLDVPFLVVERPIITTDEFIGSTYVLEYLIDKEKLHTGKNLGRITIQSQLQTLVFEVEVYQRRKKDRQLHVQHVQEAALFTDYIDFRLNRLDINTWIKRSEAALRYYFQAGGEHTMMKLYQAQVLFASEKEEDACLILEELEQHKEMLNKPEFLGYYLYLTTFHHNDTEYVDYIEKKINDLFRQNQENWKLQWILLYLQEHMIQHPAKKLEAIRKQYLYGCNSRIMYLEAYYVIEKSPLLLKRLDDFEMQMLRFVQRENLGTKDIAMQVTEVSGRNKSYSDELYRVLEYFYERYPTKDMLTVICSLLIKGQKSETKYFIWYERGIEEGLRINGLYEYYIEAMGDYREKPLPQIIRMYFSYNNTLGYQKKASVYANVIRNRSFDEQTFQGYRPTMEKFMMDQLSAGRINRDLALIYKTFLTKALMNKRMAESLGKVLFTYEIRCDAATAKYAVVLHRHMKNEQKVLLTDHTALVQIYTDDHQIFIEDAEGIRYVDSIPFTRTPIIAEPEFMRYCRELAPSSPGLVLYACGKAEKETHVNAENIENFQYLLEIEEVKETYKKQIIRKILDYYYENPGEEFLYEYLHRINYNQFIEADKRKLMELLISAGMCKEAYTLVRTYGPEKVDPGSLVRLCSRMIYDMDIEEDDMLISLCFYCFTRGKYDETVLSYLVKFYDGPLAYMKEIWRTAGKFEMDTFELEEKILAFILFLRDGVQETEEIFDEYRRKLGRKMIIQAYVIYCSYEYFVKEVQVAPLVFEYLERENVKEEQEEVCRLALLRYYAEKHVLNEQQEEYVQDSLEYYVHAGIHFEFFQKFDSALIRALQIHDKTIIEYRTNPQAKVSLCYYIEHLNGEKSSEMTEPMLNMYEGIFIKEFVLFYGDRLVYRVLEEMKGMEKKTEKKVRELNKTGETDRNTCYELLNRISGSLSENQEEKAREEIRTYLELEQLVKEIFTLS